MLVVIYVSHNPEISKTTAIIIETAECLYISIFIFSFLLSFIIDLYNFIPLTANVKIAGIKNIFFIPNVIIENIVPFFVP